MTWKEGDATALRSVAGLTTGDTLITQFADGRVASRLERIMTDDIQR